MHTAEIRIGDGDLLWQMTQMRTWLDGRRFEPSSFRYFHTGNGVVVHVEFGKDGEASAFAAQFAGRVLSSDTPAPLASGAQQLVGA